MFLNHLKLALRSLKKSNFYTFINITGLAIGLCCSLIILLFVHHELSFDQFHRDANRIYRVIMKLSYTNQGTITPYGSCFSAIGPALKKDFPEIEQMVRVSDAESMDFTYQDHTFTDKATVYVDSSFFRMFSFPLQTGHASSVLRHANTVVLSESLAKTIFGKENPIGKTLRTSDPLKQNYVVSGIFKDLPSNSHLKFSAVAPLENLKNCPDIYWGWDGGISFKTYIKLQDRVNKEGLEEKLPAFFDRHINQKFRAAGVELKAGLQSLSQIHLRSSHIEGEAAGNLSRIYIFSLVALFILVIAIINFTNLNTARALKRAKEVGIRKVVGANRANLIRQFLAESCLSATIALLIALLLIEISLPIFNEFLGTELNLKGAIRWQAWLLLPLIALLTGILSGSYPAFFLSAFSPIKTLKGNTTSGHSQGHLRKLLVLIQFVISSGLIISTLVIYQQLNFLQHKKLGYNNENLVAVPLESKTLQSKQESLIQEIRQLAHVESISASSDRPGYGFTTNGYFPEGHQDVMTIHLLEADHDYLSTMGIELLQGRNFSRDLATDDTKYFINETLAKKLGWDQPLGKVITRGDRHEVIGVVEDFHFSSLHEKIEPLIITVREYEKPYYACLNIRINQHNMSQSLEAIGQIIQNADPSTVFEYQVMEAQIEELYKPERQFRSLFTFFTLLAILIAAMGLLGLSAIGVEQRTREIGIRKVLGARVSSLLELLSREYVYLVLGANLLAGPIVWYTMNRWLDHFAYRIQMAWWMFGLALLISLLIALLTISIQTLKAARSNPVKAIQTE